VARIRLTYIGGGSTRAPGTMASLVLRGARFAGSEIVLVDLDAERLPVAALAGHPLVLSLPKAEAIYDEMAAAHRAWLPDRLLE
jgi:alpha-galactosidase/6-phospho-beta-glucosidase family protein